MKKLFFYVLFFFFAIQNFNAQELAKSEYDYYEEKDKLLNYFKEDPNPLKLKAAIFLIKNMVIHYSLIPFWTDEKGEIIDVNELQFESFEEAVKVFDDIWEKGGRQYLKKEKDFKYINSDFLIDHINYSFEILEKSPWKEKYSFKNFCEYILPYRIREEPLCKNWKERYSVLYQSAINEAEDATDPVAVCAALVNSLKFFKFSNTELYAKSPLSMDQAHLRRSGTCTDLASMAALMGRSIGLATTFDYTPYYAASSNSHYWNTVIDAKGNHIPFNGTGVIPTAYDPNIKRIGKVLRRTFSNRKEALPNNIDKSKIPFSKLDKRNVIDVTDEYVETQNVYYRFRENDKDSLAYITVYNTGLWKPLWWSKINSKRYAVFKNMGKNIVYLAALSQDTVVKERTFGKLKLEKYPIKINEQGIQQILKPDFENTFDCTLSRDKEETFGYRDHNSLDFINGKKYYLYYWEKKWKLYSSVVCENESFLAKKIPANALFKISPEEPDNFERIFTVTSSNCTIEWF